MDSNVLNPKFGSYDSYENANELTGDRHNSSKHTAFECDISMGFLEDPKYSYRSGELTYNENRLSADGPLNKGVLCNTDNAYDDLGTDIIEDDETDQETPDVSKKDSEFLTLGAVTNKLFKKMSSIMKLSQADTSDASLLKYSANTTVTTPNMEAFSNGTTEFRSDEDSFQLDFVDSDLPASQGNWPLTTSVFDGKMNSHINPLDDTALKNIAEEINEFQSHFVQRGQISADPSLHRQEIGRLQKKILDFKDIFQNHSGEKGNYSNVTWFNTAASYDFKLLNESINLEYDMIRMRFGYSVVSKRPLKQVNNTEKVVVNTGVLGYLNRFHSRLASNRSERKTEINVLEANPRLEGISSSIMHKKLEESHKKLQAIWSEELDNTFHSLN